MIKVWVEWSSREEVQPWINQELEEKEGLLALISAFTRITTTSSGTTESIIYDELNAFVAIEDLQARLHGLSEENLTDREREIINMVSRCPQSDENF